MGNWPTIFDKSATLTLGDGRRIFVASPLGLGNIGHLIASHQTKSIQDSLCCAVEGRQDKNTTKMSQLLRLVGGVGVSAVTNQNMPRKVGEYMRSGKIIAFPLPPLTLLPLAGSLGMARSLAPTMINLPSLDGIDIDNPNVTAMDETQRMLWVLLKCGEILQQTGKSEVAEAFKQLLDPKIIGLIVAGLIVWGASHFVGVGFIFDIAMVVVIGVAVIKAFETMWDIYKIITKASTPTELTRAAKMMADMVIDIGVETFLAIVLKGASKSRFRAPPSKAAGTVDEVVEYAPSRKRGQSRSESADTKSKKSKPKSRTDIIDERIKTDPKVARDVKKDENSVYGYSPKSDGSLGPLKKVDYTDPKQVAKAREVRSHYKIENGKLDAEIASRKKSILDNGGDYDSPKMKELAEDAVNGRNRIRMESNELTGTLDKMYERNTDLYKRKEGPTLDWYLKQDKNGTKFKSIKDLVDNKSKSNIGGDIVVGLWP